MQISIPLEQIQARDKDFRSRGLLPISYRAALTGHDANGGGFASLLFTYTPQDNFFLFAVNISAFVRGRNAALVQAGPEDNMKIRGYWSFDPNPYYLTNASREDTLLVVQAVGGYSGAKVGGPVSQDVVSAEIYANFAPYGIYLEKNRPFYFFYNAESRGSGNAQLHEVETTIYILQTIP